MQYHCNCNMQFRTQQFSAKFLTGVFPGLTLSPIGGLSGVATQADVQTNSVVRIIATDAALLSGKTGCK
jgi:hypothetical protein